MSTYEMKILMLTTNSSLMDGINRHILNVCPALNQIENIEVAVCTVFPYNDLNNALEQQGIKTFSLNAQNGHELRIISSYYKVMRAFAPDIVHIHVMAFAERIVSALCFRRVKYVRTVHGLADKVTKITLRMQIERLLDKTFTIPCSAVCYISNGVKEALHDNDSKIKCDVIYNPIDFSNRTMSSMVLHEEIKVSADTPIIGTACRVAKVKQPKLFTEVMCKVLTNNKKVHAVVIGDGDKELISACKEIVNNYGVSSRFHWLGYRKDAPQLVAELSCFVLTSISEGMPTSLLECMALKTPFAFFEGNGGLKDIAHLNKLHGPMAVTVKSDDIDGLSLGVCRLIESPTRGKDLAEIAYKIGKETFSADKVAQKLVSVYNHSL